MVPQLLSTPKGCERKQKHLRIGIVPDSSMEARVLQNGTCLVKVVLILLSRLLVTAYVSGKQSRYGNLVGVTFPRTLPVPIMFIK